MKDKKSVNVTIVFTIALTISTGLLEASYYQQDLFPIGLSGIMVTGKESASYSCPYGYQGWTWQKERQLITALGANCLGSEDVHPSYLIDLKPLNPYTNNYLHQVCGGIDSSYLRAILT